MSTFEGHQRYSHFPTVVVDGPDDGTHRWIEFLRLTCCASCGNVRRADGLNAPCKGPVHVILKEEAS